MTMLQNVNLGQIALGRKHEVDRAENVMTKALSQLHCEEELEN